MKCPVAAAPAATDITASRCPISQPVANGALTGGSYSFEWRLVECRAFAGIYADSDLALIRPLLSMAPLWVPTEFQRRPPCPAASPTTPAGTVLNAGTNMLSVVFTPADTVDYSSGTDSVSLVVIAGALDGDGGRCEPAL